MTRLVGEAYQYLQRSKILTNKFQSSLFRLKIPSLEQTKQRYLTALEPVFKDDLRYTKTCSLVNDFFKTQANDLQAQLLQYDKTQKNTSYINNFWFNMYLSSRIPLPLNFNPFLAWKDAATEGLNDQLVRSTNFIVSAIRFNRSLEENVLEPEVFSLGSGNTSQKSLYKNVISMTPDIIATPVSYLFKVFPLDMSQYKNLFSSTRIPAKDKDYIKKASKSESKHVVVLRGGQFYVFDVLDSAGDLIAPEAIYANMKAIAAMPRNKSHQSISELTAGNRDFWAGEREHLISLSVKNKSNLDKIDSAIFAICLDDVTFELDQVADGAHNFLHGCNKSKPLNRWFDKSFSLIVTKDGHSAINFEHSWGDGVAVLRFFNDTYADSNTNAQITEPSEVDLSLANVKELEFDLDNRIKESIRVVKDEFVKQTENLELGAVKYEKQSRDFFKKYNLSPDSMNQLAFQLAFKKAYNSTPVTYESCSTAAFRGGRTETVRPCTKETNECCDALLKRKQSDLISKSDIKALLSKCSVKHFQLCKEASMGSGFDRHLFALKEIGLMSNANLHPIFSDPVYLDNQKYVLSTSTLYGASFQGGGFAPVVENGFGLGYGHVDSSFGVLVSSYKSARKNAEFASALEESLEDIRLVFE